MVVVVTVFFTVGTGHFTLMPLAVTALEERLAFNITLRVFVLFLGPAWGADRFASDLWRYLSGSSPEREYSADEAWAKVCRRPRVSLSLSLLLFQILAISCLI